MSGELVIGGSTIPGEYVMPTLIGRFKGKYPDISVSRLIGDARQVREWVEEGGVEVALVGARPGSRALESRELMPDELVLVVPAGHPWATRKSVSVDELRREPMVMRERGSGSREAIEHVLEEAGLSLASFRLDGEIRSTQAIKQAVHAGVGIALISHRAVVGDYSARPVLHSESKDLRVARKF